MIEAQNDDTLSATTPEASDSGAAHHSSTPDADRPHPLSRQILDRLRRGRRPRLGAILVALVAVVSLATGFRACNCNQAWTEVSAGATPESNPLKGMMPFAPSDASHSPALPETAPPYTMEWLTLPVSDVVTGPGTYSWTTLEAHLNAIASRGHQTVLRFYVDYPGRSSSMPR